MNEPLPTGGLDMNPAFANPQPLDMSSIEPVSPRIPTIDIATLRAAKASVGTPELFPDPTNLRERILTGEEKAAREQAASFLAAEQRAKQESVIQAFVTAKQGQPLNDQDKGFINEYLKRQRALELGGIDPKTVFEEAYGHSFTENIKKSGELEPDSFWSKMSPEDAHDWVRRGSKVVARQEILQTQIDEARQQAEEQGWPSYILDTFKEWTWPGYYHLKLTGLQNSFFIGKNLDQQGKYGWSLSNNDDFKVWLSESTQGMNPGMKLEWLSAMQGMSHGQEALYNLATFGDFTGKPLGAGLAIKGIKAGAEHLLAREAIGSALQARLREPPSLAATQEAAGNLRAAAATDVAQQLADTTRGVGNPISRILNNMHASFTGEVDSIRSNPGHLRREEVERIIQNNIMAGDEITQSALRKIQLDRLEALHSYNEVTREAMEKAADKYSGIDNMVLNTAPRYDQVTNTWYGDTILGLKGNSLWDKRATAEKWAKQYLPNQEVRIEPQGNKFTVTVSDPLPINRYFSDLVYHMEGVKLPESTLNSFIGRFITPEETLSRVQRSARHVVAYGMSTRQEVANKIAKDFKDLRRWSGIPFTNARAKWLDFKRVLSAAEKETGADGRPGIIYQTPAQLEEAYGRVLKRLPDPQEVRAYFAWKNLGELENTWENLQLHIARLHEGAQTHTLTLYDPAKETPRSSVPGKTITIDGTELKHNEFPTSGRILVIDRLAGNESVKDAASLNRSGSKAGAILKEEILDGKKKLVKVSQFADYPLKDINPKLLREELIEHVIVPADQMKTKELQWFRMPRRAPQSEYNHYVRQAIIKDGMYLGDRTLSAHMIRGEGTRYVKDLNDVREAIFAKNLDEAKRIHAASSIPQEFSEVRGWFMKGKVRGVDGKWEAVPAKYALDRPLYLVPKGKMVTQVDLGATKAATEKQFGRFRDVAGDYGKYTGEKYDPRDIFSFRNEGTTRNPDYKVVPVEFLDPIVSINRSLNRAITGNFLNDYKKFAISHWFEQAAPYLNVSRSRWLAAPDYYFHTAGVSPGDKAMWKTVDGNNLIRVRNLQTANLQIRQFMGVADPTDSWLHSVAQKLSDSMYERNKPGLALAAEHLLPHIRDPYQFLRTMTFHAKLGFFNPAQLLVQAQTMATTYAIAGPKYAVPGTKAGMLYAWASKNRSPEIIDALDRLATKKIIPGTSEWRPGEFKEFLHFTDESGFMNVANEHAFRNDPYKNNVITGNGKTFLDVGTIPFRYGEKSSRVVAIATAFREFRHENPTGALTNPRKQQILDRADLLYGNMSRASSSTIQHGILSIPTQFLAYQMRMAEIAFGRRITTAERMRLFGTYAAIYGIPGALGLTGLPLGDTMRKELIKEGYNPGDDYIRTTFDEGIPAMILAMVFKATTGKEEYFDFQGRYGINGFEPIRQFLRSDKTAWDIFTGATGGTIGGLIGSSYGFFKAMGDLVTQSGRYPLKLEDLLGPAREISTISAAAKLITSMNIAKTITKNGRILEDTTPAQSIFSFLSGLQKTTTTDAFLKWQIKDEEKAVQKEAIKRVTHDVQQGIIAHKNGDPQQADDFWRRSSAWLTAAGVPEDQWNEIYANAYQGYESLVDQGNWDFAFGKSVPKQRQDTAAEQQDALRRKKLQ